MEGQTNSSFISMLFDFSFTEFITTKLIRVLYMIGILLVGLWCVALLLSSFSLGAGAGIVALLIIPIPFIFGVAVLRVQLELVMVVFRIADNTAAMAEGRAAGPE
jgi:hypothetical protein